MGRRKPFQLLYRILRSAVRTLGGRRILSEKDTKKGVRGLRWFPGMALSWLMRFHLVCPNAKIFGLDLLSKTGTPGSIIAPE